MKAILKDIAMSVTAIEVVIGAAIAQLGAFRPRSLPRFLRVWLRSALPSKAGSTLLMVQGVGWLMATAVSAVLLIPFLPAYTSFRWIDSMLQASASVTGKLKRFDDITDESNPR